MLVGLIGLIGCLAFLHVVCEALTLPFSFLLASACLVGNRSMPISVR